MLKSNVTIGEESFTKMLDGISVATQAIRLAYGAKGINISVENEFYPFSETANDAQTIIQAIQVEDKVAKIGLNYLKELSDKANKDSGDGRKTTCILAEEILTEAYDVDLSGNQLKEELDALIPLIEKNLDEQKKIITEREVESVASISGESKTLGKLLGEIYQRIGKDGIIIPESSGTYTTTVDYRDGIRFADTGFLSPYMVSEGQKEKAIYENPLILVTKKKIEKDSEVDGLVQTAINNNQALVIFTDDMDSGVASRLVATHKAKVAKILIIKAPVMWKNYVFEDFAKVTGATIVEDASGLNYKNLKLEHLGTCAKITVDKDETTIVSSVDYSDHIASLKADGTDDSKLRLSWLTTKTCILKLGANNESELSHLRLKCHDAINSSRLALKDGIVVGGGISLKIASVCLPDTVAGNILKKALQAPLAQNLANMGIVEPNWGDEVVDACAVVKNAVRNAISLASTVITTGGVINLPEKTPEQLAQLALQQKGLRM